jgi:6-phosphogluconolactonase
MNLRIFETGDELARAAARTLLQLVRPGEPATIVVTGGATPKRLYEMLGQPPWREELAKVPIAWALLDERYVPVDDPQSNAGMIERSLFAQGMSPSHRWLRFRTELDDPAATARAYEEEWRALGIADVDLMLLGVGDDGHTASLFPGTAVLDVEDRIASEVFVPRLDQWRVTLTLPVIRAAKLRLVLATGEAKAPILREVGEGTDHPIARATKGVETWWLVDRAASSVEKRPSP